SASTVATSRRWPDRWAKRASRSIAGSVATTSIPPRTATELGRLAARRHEVALLLGGEPARRFVGFEKRDRRAGRVTLAVALDVRQPQHGDGAPDLPARRRVTREERVVDDDGLPQVPRGLARRRIAQGPRPEDLGPGQIVLGRFVAGMKD